MPMNTHSERITAAAVLSAGLLFILTACNKSEKGVVSTPKEAAVHIEQVFKEAPPTLKKEADTASEALRTGDYEKAIVSLDTMRTGNDITPEQLMAIHSSMVTLETKLINAMEAGDEKARKGFELLKQLHRN